VVVYFGVLSIGFLMKQILLGAIAFLAIGAAPALAADLPARTYTKAPAVVPPPAFSWTGFYVGVNGGYGWGKDPVSFGPANASAIPIFAAGAVPPSINTKPAGGLAGMQIGYNWQWTPNWVVGIEADIDWANISGTGVVATSAPSFIPYTNSAQQNLSSIGTLRGRIGYAVDRVLFYGTGGLAYGQTKLNTSAIALATGSPSLCGPYGLCAASSSTQWQTGWTAGAGIEWAFSPQWSFKGEYLHYDLGSHNQNLSDPADFAVFNSSATYRGDIVRAGVNYRFNSGPVVARY
jgi:outer membrane immunogenic protein